MRRKLLRNGAILRNCAIGLGLLVIAGFLARDFLFFTFLYSGTRADLELGTIRREIEVVRGEYYGARRSGISDGELESLFAKFEAREAQLRQRCLEIAEHNPGTKAELGALYFVAGEWPESVEGQYALETLIEVSETADLDHLGKTFDSIHATRKESMRPLIPVLLQLERENPNHPYAAKLLTEACLFLAPGEDAAAVPNEFSKIADVIVERHATSPKLANFCEQLGRGDWSPPWAQPFESHLRRILEVNKDRFVRCSAKIALASLVQESGADRQPEAATLYEEFLAEFDGTVKYYGRGIEEMYRENARRAIEVIRSHGLGKQAPDTIGNDLDDNPITLADYRGKVVLVSFWATWCYPCMKMIPHEKELVERFSADKFAIVGVNGDTEIEAARDAVEKNQISWRSFRHNSDGQESVADEWHIAGWPTFYLLDANGTVRKRWIGEPPLGELNDSIERLIDKEMSETSTAGHPSQNLQSDSDVRSTHPIIEVVNDAPGTTGFIGKTYASNGNEFKYVVFIPANYGDETKYPAILFLHGAGAIGTDGKKQLTGALANAIVQRDSFPFIAVFPQASDGDWQGDSPDGQRAIAILDQVCAEYSIDTSRVSLTGYSMGGEGTWSLAAAHPDRWAAIVPICGGGDPGIAHRIKHIPCWCFQGDADRSNPPWNSSRMVEAIRKAGGQPTYHEYQGVGHNCWDRTYARTDLYEWLLSQRR